MGGMGAASNTGTGRACSRLVPVRGVYVVVKPAAVRAGPELSSPRTEVLRAGEHIAVQEGCQLPSGELRARCTRGWVSVWAAAAGEAIIQPVSAPRPGGIGGAVEPSPQLLLDLAAELAAPGPHAVATMIPASAAAFMPSAVANGQMLGKPAVAPDAVAVPLYRESAAFGAVSPGSADNEDIGLPVRPRSRISRLASVDGRGGWTARMAANAHARLNPMQVGTTIAAFSGLSTLQEPGQEQADALSEEGSETETEFEVGTEAEARSEVGPQPQPQPEEAELGSAPEIAAPPVVETAGPTS
eukprot:COSAG01_NODE_18343_length_1083_cov_1.275407_1_plen_299_part_10